MAQSNNTQEYYGLLAEFDTPAALYTACEKVRDAGFQRWDAHTPFPVHGLDDAMGLKRTKLPYISTVMGLTGTSLAFLMQWYMNAVDYRYIISGKPFASWPAFIPVAFELTILFAAVGTILGMFGFNQLPTFYHSLFNSKRFEKVTDDKFFISIEAEDPLFESEKTAAFLKECGADFVEKVDL